MTEITDPPGTAPPGELDPTRPNLPGRLRPTPSSRSLRHSTRGSAVGWLVGLLIAIAVFILAAAGYLIIVRVP